MTKNQAAKVGKFLRDNIDAPFLCAIRTQSKGIQCFAQSIGDPTDVAMLFLAQMNTLFKTLKGTPEQNAEFRNFFIEMLIDAAKEWSPHDN